MTSAEHTAMFTVIGSKCDACHNAVTPPLSFYGVSNLTTRPSDHNSGDKKSDDCSSCHSPKNWDGGQQKKATAAASAKSNSTIGTVVSHPVFAAAGATLGPAPSRALLSHPDGAGRAVSHAGVTSNCVGCHNGILATGKGATHLPTNNQCENCHTTMAWLPARFDHQGIASTCSSCHNGILAAGRPTRHVVSSEDCSACHSTLAWTPARFTHLNISGSCRSCHNNITAPGKPLQHVSTTLDCGSCHNTQDWSQAPSGVAPATKSPSAAARGNARTTK
jgi:hypothetical protein